MDSSDMHDGRSGRSPERQQVLAALRRILDSEGFAASDRHRQFLSYVVEETLSGRADRLKGYTIAVQVFGRDTTFDAQTDPLVRIEARRLRQSLEHYYLTSGRTDPVRISIPKGGYVPVFEQVISAAIQAAAPPPAPNKLRSGERFPRTVRMLAASLATAAVACLVLIAALHEGGDRLSGGPTVEAAIVGPMLLIDPVSTITGSSQETALARGLAEELTAALSRFKTIQVVPSANGEARSGSADSRAFDRDRRLHGYRLKGSVRTLEHLVRVVVNLEDNASGSILWTRTFDAEPEEQNASDIESEIASRVAGTLGDPYDVLFSAEAMRARSERSAAHDSYRCVLGIYAYGENPTASEHRALRDCHEKTVAAMPLYADAWLNLTWLYLDEYRFDFNPMPPSQSALDRAADAARHGLSLQPDGARAHLAMAMVHWFRHDFRSFDEQARIALSLNRNDPLVAAELGMRLALRGDWGNARALLDRVVRRDPIRWQRYRIAFALQDAQAGDYAAALEEMRRTRVTDHPVIQFLRAAIYGQVGQISEAQTAWHAAIRQVPNLADEPRTWLVKRGLSDELTSVLMQGLDKAGVLVTD